MEWKNQIEREKEKNRRKDPHRPTQANTKA